MAVLQQRVVRPKKGHVRRALEAREPKAVEDQKRILLVRGGTCSDRVLRVLRDLHSLKRPASSLMSRKHEMRPWEDQAVALEAMAKKEDAAAFAFGSSNKKRPDNLILGCFYDGHLLDMQELGVTRFKSLSDFKNEKVAAEIKPCLTFSGPGWESSPEMKRLKTLFIDLFRGPEVANVRLAGVEHCLQFTALDERTVYMRSYKILLRKSSDDPRLPRVELEEIGPALDLVLRRSHLASDDLYKTACQQVKNVRKQKKVKNIEEDAFGSTLGRLHVPGQDVSKVQTRKMKGLKEAKKAKMAEKREKAAAAKAKNKKAEEEEEGSDMEEDEAE